MLILGRVTGDCVDLLIEGKVVATVTVVDIQRSDGQGYIRLGFDALPEVKIIRREIRRLEAQK
jgi:sRNA-binding carbon storage regulator CsrA